MHRDFLRTAQRTESLDIQVARQELITSFGQRFVNLGSCFAINMQRVLQPYGFHAWYDKNICGHYSSASMASVLEMVAEGREHGPDELYEYKDQWGGYRPYQYFFKRRIHGPNAVQRTLDAISALDEECRRELRSCSHVIITLGTARVMRLRRTGKLIVAARGIPETDYEYDLLSVQQVVADLERITSALAAIRGGDMPHVFITISPQRYHFKNIPGRDHIDPFVDNVLYKSILRVAVEEFLTSRPDQPFHYFPAFEIVMEELRLFESLAHYDFLHIEQDFTPKLVIKKFLKAYAVDAILRQLGILDDANVLYANLRDALFEEMDPDNPHAVESTERLINEAREAAVTAGWCPALAKVLKKLTDSLERSRLFPDLMEAAQDAGLRESERVVIWGTEQNYRDHWAAWIGSPDNTARVLGFVDGNPEKWGQKLDGYTIYPPKELAALRPETVIIASVFRQEITDHIRKHLSGVRVL